MDLYLSDFGFTTALVQIFDDFDSLNFKLVIELELLKSVVFFSAFELLLAALFRLSGLALTHKINDKASDAKKK